MLAGIAEELLRKLFRGCTIVKLSEVFGLSIRRSLTNLHDGELVSANASIEDLVLSGCGVEEPLPIRVFLQRNGDGEAVSAHEQHLFTIGQFAPAMHDAVLGYKGISRCLVLNGIARGDELFRIGSEDGQQLGPIASFDGCEDRIRGIVRGGKCLDGGFVGFVTGSKWNDQRQKEQSCGSRHLAGFERHLKPPAHSRRKFEPTPLHHSYLRPRLYEPRALASLDCHPLPLNADEPPVRSCSPYPLEELPWVCCQPLPVFL